MKAKIPAKTLVNRGSIASKQTGRHEASPTCPAASTASPQANEVPMTASDPSTTPPVRTDNRVSTAQAEETHIINAMLRAAQGEPVSDFEESFTSVRFILDVIAEKNAVIARLRTLAKEATNGWACYARTNLEHDEITRLHQSIDGRPLDRHVFAICPECKWRTRDDRKPQHRVGCSRPAPTAWVDQNGDPVIPPANTEAVK